MLPQVAGQQATERRADPCVLIAKRRNFESIPKFRVHTQPDPPRSEVTRTGPFTRILGWISYVMVAVVDYTVTRRLNFPARMRAQDDD